MSQQDLANLGNKTKTQLLELVKKLAAENTELKEMNQFMESTCKRLINLERQQNKSLQYMRRDTIEVSGIPTNIDQNSLENEVINIFNAADVSVHGNRLTHMDIHACHRIGKKKEITICKFVNRKFG